MRFVDPRFLITDFSWLGATQGLSRTRVFRANRQRSTEYNATLNHGVNIFGVCRTQIYGVIKRQKLLCETF